MTRKHNLLALGVLCSLAAPAVSPQNATETALALKRSSYIEFGVSYDRLSAGEKDWYGAVVRLNTPITENDRLDAELAYQNRYGDDGLVGTVGVTHTFNEDWYGRLAFGSSYQGFFLPNWRVDASISRKWLPGRNLVTTLGLGYLDEKDEHSNYMGLASLLYYFEAPFIVELGARFNRSNPGSMDSQRYFGVLTYGREKERYVTFKYETGEESYQVLGRTRLDRSFNSDEVTLIWRQWLSEDYGFNVRAQHYSNPSYDRDGLEFAVFIDF